MQFTFQNSKQPIPAGTYYANFVGVEPYTNTKFDKPSINWKFVISQGDYKDKTITRITGTSPTANNACGRLLMGLWGKQPAEGESVDVSACIGQRYICTFSGTRIETVARMPE